MDPTRRLLKVFGVKVTDYEEKTAGIVERCAAADAAERARLLAEAVELTADLTHWLREIQAHVLDREESVLRKLGEQ